MTEVPCYFPADAGRLFGILHEPAVPSRGTGVVLVYPLAEEKLWAQRVFVAFARDLAALGYPVLRFDFRGEGDSHGAFQETSLESRLADLSSAVSWLRERFPELEGIGLIGLRFGALLAAVYAACAPPLRFLVLWDPLIDGARYMQELLRSNLATQASVFKEVRFTREQLVAQMIAGGTVNVDGYELAHAFYEQASAVNLLTRPAAFPGRCLIVQIDRPGAKPRKDLEELSSLYPRGVLATAREEPFWKEIKTFCARAPELADVTLRWLEETVDDA